MYSRKIIVIIIGLALLYRLPFDGVIATVIFGSVGRFSGSVFLSSLIENGDIYWESNE